MGAMGKQEIAKLVDRFNSLRKQLWQKRREEDAILKEMAGLPVVGRYRPNAVLRVCRHCGGGPFDAHEIRMHKPRCEGRP